MSDITGVGFLHLGKDHTEPIRALEDSISAFKLAHAGCSVKGLENTLVVLPEAFNIGTEYYGPGASKHHPQILKDLARISNDNQCAFIVGLVIREETPSVEPPYSSAYLIDGVMQPKRLARKRKSDTAEKSRAACHGLVARYTACPSYEPEAVAHRGLGVGAFICDDAQSGDWKEELPPPHDYDGRLRQMAAKLSSLRCRQTVLCIPACMQTGFGKKKLGENVLIRPWLEGAILVLANSYSQIDVYSWVTDRTGTIIGIRREGGEKENEIVVVPLPTEPKPSGQQDA